MVEKKTVGILVTSLGVGSAQTYILREYVDKVHGKIPGLEGLGGFGTYSAMGGIIAGGITTVAGLVSFLTKKITKNVNIQMGLIGYGIPALSGGILSGVFPVETPLLRAAPAGARLNKASPTSVSGLQVNLRSAGNIPVKRASKVVPNVRAGANQAVGQAFPLRT